MGAPRRKPSQLALGIGIGFAGLTALSGATAAWLGWNDEHDIHRSVFVDIPGALQVVFYVSTAVCFLGVGWMFAQRFGGYERGAPDDRRTTGENFRRRVADFRAGVYMQTLMRDGAAGLMHSLMYFPFLGLFAVTTVLEIDHSLPSGAKFLHGGAYQAFSAFGDLMGVLFLVGLVWAFARRYVIKVYRIRIKTRPEDAVILGILFLLGLTGLLTEGARIALMRQPNYEKWSFVGYPISYLFRNDVYRTTDFSAVHQAASHVHQSPEHVSARPGTAEGGHEAGPRHDRDHARDIRRRGDRGLHLEAAIGHRCLHGVRPVHRGLPGPRHREVPRPSRDRPQGG